MIDDRLRSRTALIAPERVPSAGSLVPLLVLLSVTTYFQRTSMPIAGPEIAREFGFSTTQLGSIYSAFLLGYTLAMIPGGGLVDRFGPRLVLGIVAALTAVFTILTAVAANTAFGSPLGVLTALLLVRLVLGVSTAPLYPSAARMNANWMPPHRRGSVQGWIAAGAGIGGALSPYVFRFIISGWGWRAAFLTTGLITFVIAAFWFAVARDYPERSGPREPERAEGLTGSHSWLRLLSNRNLMLITLSYVAACYFEYIFYYWTYYYLGEVRHAGSETAAMFTTILFLSWMVFAPLGGKLSDFFVERFGRKTGMRFMPVLGLSLAALFTCVALNLASVTATGLCMALALGLAAASDAAFWAAAIEAGGGSAGFAGGILNTGGNLGGFAAPILTAMLASQLGWSAGLYFGCGLAVAGASLWFFIDPSPVVGDALFRDSS